MLWTNILYCIFSTKKDILLLDLSTAIKHNKLWLTASIQYSNSCFSFSKNALHSQTVWLRNMGCIEVSGLLGHLQLQTILLSLRFILLARLKMHLSLGLCDVSPRYHPGSDTFAGASLSCAMFFSSHLLGVHTSDLPVSSDGHIAPWNGVLSARLDPSKISGVSCVKDTYFLAVTLKLCKNPVSHETPTYLFISL